MDTADGTAEDVVQPDMNIVLFAAEQVTDKN
jgi:hypothetical protein